MSEVILTAEEAEAVWDYIQGDGIDADLISIVLQKIEPVLAQLREEEVN